MENAHKETGGNCRGSFAKRRARGLTNPLFEFAGISGNEGPLWCSRYLKTMLRFLCALAEIPQPYLSPLPGRATTVSGHTKVKPVVASLPGICLRLGISQTLSIARTVKAVTTIAEAVVLALVSMNLVFDRYRYEDFPIPQPNRQEPSVSQGRQTIPSKCPR